MGTQSAGAKRREQSRDVLSAAELFVTLGQVVRFREQPGIADPLQHAMDRMSANPAIAQSQLLKRILGALVTWGDFRRAEASALDASTHALVMSLLEVRRTDARSRQAWDEAIEAVEAASAEDVLVRALMERFNGSRMRRTTSRAQLRFALRMGPRVEAGRRGSLSGTRQQGL